MTKAKCAECGHERGSHFTATMGGVSLGTAMGICGMPDCFCTSYRPVESEPCPDSCEHTAAEHEAFDAGLQNETFLTHDPHLGEIYQIGHSVWQLNQQPLESDTKPETGHDMSFGAAMALIERRAVYMSESGVTVRECLCGNCHVCAARIVKSEATTLTAHVKELEGVVEGYEEMLSGENVQIQFDRGKYRINYFGVKPSDTFGLWSASSLRDGHYLGDPQRFYPLADLLELVDAVIKEQNAKANK